MKKKAKKRLGRVGIKLNYVVDLDNADMVQYAKDCIFEDLMNSQKYNELGGMIDVWEDKTASTGDIPEFLTELSE